MSPGEQKIITSARRKVKRYRIGIVFLVVWAIALGVLIRLGNDEKKNIDRQPLAEQAPYKQRVTYYMMTVVGVFLAGIIFGPHIFASPAERLLVKILDEKENGA